LLRANDLAKLPPDTTPDENYCSTPAHLSDEYCYRHLLLRRQNLLDSATAVSSLEVIISANMLLVNEDIWYGALSGLLGEVCLNVGTFVEFIELENFEAFVTRNLRCESPRFMAVRTPRFRKNHNVIVVYGLFD